MSQSETTPVYSRRVPWIAHLIVSIIILFVAFGVVKWMFGAKPEARRWGGNKPVPSVAVETSALNTRDYQVWIESYGTVQPLTQTELVAEVNGRVIEVSEKIRAGGRFSKDEVLVKLDDRDFLVAVDVAASEASQAKVAYLQEIAEAELAAKDWNKRPSSETAKLLALREPQVAAAKAALNAANARLSQAELNLERTRIRAPFDGMVLTQSIDIGQVVNSTQTIATIYSTDTVEVRLPVKIGDLDYLTLPDSTNSTRPRVRLIGELGTRTYQWDGKIVRSEGAFDAATRTLFVVAQIDSPFDALPNRPAIRVGQFLRAEVQGQTLNDVFVVPRKAVSQDFTVSVMDDGLLRKRQISPLWTDRDSVVIGHVDSYTTLGEPLLTQSTANQLQVGDKLILTPVSNLADGTRIKALNEMQEKPERGSRIAGKNEAKSSASTAAAPASTSSM